jgi:hypothetical protein
MKKRLTKSAFDPPKLSTEETVQSRIERFKKNREAREAEAKKILASPLKKGRR